jgi:hypothetical protein
MPACGHAGDKIPSNTIATAVIFMNLKHTAGFGALAVLNQAGSASARWLHGRVSSSTSARALRGVRN